MDQSLYQLLFYSLHETNRSWKLFFFIWLNFRNQSVFDVWAGDVFVELLQPFDPTNSGKDTLARGTQHNWKAWGVELCFKTHRVILLLVLVQDLVVTMQTADRSSISTDLGYRFQPFVNISINTDYNNLDLPLPEGKTHFG